MDFLDFRIQNASGQLPEKVFICFYFISEGHYMPDAVRKGTETLHCGVWHQLSEVKEGCSFTSNASGRIYVAYADGESGLPVMCESSLPSLFSCQTRMDKFELTFDGSATGCADLTAIDDWAIPMSLVTSQNGNAVGSLSGVCVGYSVSDVYKALCQLSVPARSKETIQAVVQAFQAAGHPLADGVLDWFETPQTAVKRDSNERFLRIVGPNSYPSLGDPKQGLPPGKPVTPYYTFQIYLNYLQQVFAAAPPAGYPADFGNGNMAHIAGTYAGVGANPEAPSQIAQHYDLWARLDQDCNLRLVGNGDVVGSIDASVQWFDLLNPAAGYGANPLFSLNGGDKAAPGNDVYGWIFGDFFAALNVGALGSEKMTSDGRMVGAIASQDCFVCLKRDGLLFEKLWSEKTVGHWNTWAATLNPMSDAYNFAYAERFSAPQLNLDPAKVDTLTLTLLDTSGVE